MGFVDMTPLDTLFARNEAEKFAFENLTGPEQAREQLRMFNAYAKDPWLFLTRCVFTLNQVAQENGIQPYPAHLEYLQFLTQMWIKNPLMACPKSRRMFCSWNFISLYLHDTLFKPTRFNGFVSKKEDDSAELVARAEFIYRHIPEWRIPRALLPKLANGRMSKQPPLLDFPEINSKIQGFPSGSDQLRQFTLSGILGDEAAFWPDAEAFYSASKPTLDGGGKMTLISSRSPGFFRRIVFDKFDAIDPTFREVAPVPSKQPLEGVEVWKNPKNKFVVVDLHYTADPAKRSPEWREAVKSSMTSRSFEMEYNKSWSTFEGQPVYADFNRTLHVSSSKLVPEPGIPLLLGWDFGLTPACILAQLVGKQLRIYKEFIETNGSISKLAPVVMNHLNINYQNWMHDDKLYSFIDPAGLQRKDTDETTCAGVLRKLGFRDVRPGPVNWEPRRKAVDDFLTKTYGDGPAFIIDEGGCPILIEGFAGGYRYPEKALEVEPMSIRPVKDKYSHPHDALQYLCAGATQLKRSHNIDLPPPNYGFQTA